MDDLLKLITSKVWSTKYCLKVIEQAGKLHEFNLILEKEQISSEHLIKVLRWQLNYVPRCKCCNKLVNFADAEYCSYKCSNNSTTEYRVQRMRENCKERYGVEHHAQVPEIRKKMAEGWKKKYSKGSEELKELQERTRKTNLEKYGNKNLQRVVSVREKIKQTNIERYGISNAHSDEVLLKINKNKKRKQYQILKEKLKEEKYLQLEDTIDEFVDGDRNIFTCLRCGLKLYGVWPYGLKRHSIFCPHCYAEKKSIGEYELKCYIESLIDPLLVKHNDRKVLNGKELDVYIESMNIAFEFNGDYFHANPEIYKKDDIIRLPNENKTAEEIWDADDWKIKECKNQNIVLYQIWQSDWENHKTQTRKYISSIIRG